jgi:hypothetical protein
MKATTTWKSKIETFEKGLNALRGSMRTETIKMKRRHGKPYRRISLSDQSLDGGSAIPKKEGCPLCARLQRFL